MGNPIAYWYPAGDAGPLATVDLGEGLSDLSEEPNVPGVDARAGDGATATVVYGGNNLIVHIMLERFGSSGNGSSSLERSLRSMEAHLHAGNPIAFSRDSAKSWASASEARIGAGAGFIPLIGASPFRDWSSGALADGDEVVIEAPPPTMAREYTTSSGAVASTGTTFTPVEVPRYVYPTGSIVRYRWFWPVLRLLPDWRGRTIVHHDHRRNFTFEAAFEYALAESAVACGVGVGWDESEAGAVTPYGTLAGQKSLSQSGGVQLPWGS